MNPELLHVHAQLIACKTPEDLFGKLRGSDLSAQLLSLKRLYHQLARVAHADKYLLSEEQKLANTAFALLNAFHREAELLLTEGKYGTGARATARASTPPILRSKKGIYSVANGFASGDISTLYLSEFDGRTPVLAKVSSSPVFNNLLEVESLILSRLNEAAKPTTAFRQFVPTLLDSFTIQLSEDSSIRQVNVFNKVDGLRSLHDVVSQYPTGVDARHFVWIFNRLLSTLSFVHSQGIIHGAILPSHILIHPTSHAIHLVDWCFAVPTGRPIVAMSKNYTSYYAPEVKAKRPTFTSTDIYQAAMCMSYVLGGDFGEAFPPSVPPKFVRLLQTCLFANPARRPSDAWTLLEEVQQVAKETFGPKKYVKLEMV
jgi:hypothetical protein